MASAPESLAHAYEDNDTWVKVLPGRALTLGPVKTLTIAVKMMQGRGRVWGAEQAIVLGLMAGLTLVACGDDDPAGGGGDPDAGQQVTLDGDVVEMDMGVVEMDTGVTEDDPSVQIQVVIDAPTGQQGPQLPIGGAVVTYVRPAIGDDPAGFFLQADSEGPAIFIAVDPATLTPTPEVGDRVSLLVAETAVEDGQTRVTMISGFNRIDVDNDVNALVQDLTNAADVVSNLASYESELITITGVLTGNFASGNAHRRIQLSTAGLPDEDNLRFRIAETVLNELSLEPGCTVTVGPTPLWRLNETAQPSAWQAEDVELLNCEAPQVLSARAPTSTTVEVTFSRSIDASSVTPGAFAFVPTLAVNSASVAGTLVTLTTATMPELTTYTVTVDTGVVDDLGNGIDPNNNTATFLSPGIAPPPQAAGELVISEIMPNPAALSDTAGEYFEVYNPTTNPYDLDGCTVSDDDGDSHTISGSVLIGPGGYITLARSAMPGFVPTYVYSGFVLGNSGGDEVIISCGGVEIDRVNYDGGTAFPVGAGASMNLAPDSLNATANDSGANWCASTSSYNGDLGTPNAANDSCAIAVDGGIIDDGGVVTPDGGIIGDGGMATPDGGMPGGPGTPNGAGQLVISEVMQNPATVGDTAGEWFELYNPSASATYNLNGCVISDDGSDLHTITGTVTVTPGAYVTLARGSAPGFTPDYVYGGAYQLANSSDEVILTCGGVEIDRVAYDNGATFPDPNGASMNLDPARLDSVANDIGSNWCVATVSYNGDLGTPGAANSSCGVVGMPDAGLTDGGGVADGGIGPDATMGPDGMVIVPDVGVADAAPVVDATVGGVDAGVADAAPVVDATVGGVDAGSADSGGLPDGSVSMDAGVTVVTPTVAGQLVLTEIMHRPVTVAEPGGEWFEVHNPSPTVTYDLGGCDILDGGTDAHNIVGPLWVPPGGYVTLARTASVGFAPDYVYGTDITMENVFDEVFIKCSPTLSILRVDYDNGLTYPNTAGASMNLDPAFFDEVSNDIGTNWCVATASYNGDFGTPGGPNTTCP